MGFKGLNMKMARVFCSTILILVTFYVASAAADGRSCGALLFSNERPVTIDKSYIQRESFMHDHLHESISQLRQVNAGRDHLPFLADQLPHILSKLYVQLNEASSVLENRKHQFTKGELPGLRKRAILKETLDTELKKLTEQAQSRLKNQEVTYEWYMAFFLKSLIYADVASKVSYNKESANTALLMLRLRELSSNGLSFFSESAAEIAVHSALSNSYSHMMPHTNFMRHRHRLTLIPVLFKPTKQDVLLAETLGARFITLSATVTEGNQSKVFPLEYAGQQVLESVESINPYGAK